jgi:DNA invertase Pin-like site-specific DNA recombinase
LYCRVSLDQDGTEKSVNDQEIEGRAWVRQEGALLEERHVYRDSDRSASRFATKQRESFNRLLDDIDNGELDAVWFWELSRQQRRLDVFAKLRDLCRERGVMWVIRDRVYDPSSYADMMAAGVLSLVAENESELTSQRVQRGKHSSAHRGRPAGKVPYGYRRIWNPETGKWERDEPLLYDGNGHPVDDSPAAVVREIYDRIAAGESLTKIRQDLNDRGIRSARGYPWDNYKIRYIALSPTYLGHRVYRVDEHYTSRSGDRSKAVLPGVEAQWPPLVDPETYWTVHRILTDPKRRTTRLGPRTGQHLLTALGRCAECGGKFVRRRAPANHKRTEHTWIYSCRDRNCVGISVVALDEYVEKVVVAWLSDPAVAADLTQNADNSAAAKQARADAERSRSDLQQLHADVERGLVSPTIATHAERGLVAVIEDAEQRLQGATLPSVLVGNIGPRAKAGWDALDMDAKRLLIRTVADIRVRRVGRGYRVPVQDRVEWRWLLTNGHGHGNDNETDNHDTAESAAESTGDPIADRIAAALADAGPGGLTRTEIRKAARVSSPTARYDAALQVLVDSGRAVRSSRVAEGRRGRTAEVWTSTTGRLGI